MFTTEVMAARWGLFEKKNIKNHKWTNKKNYLQKLKKDESI